MSEKCSIYDDAIKVLPYAHKIDLFHLGQDFDRRQLLLLAALDFMSLKLEMSRNADLKKKNIRNKFKIFKEEVESKRFSAFSSERFLIVYCIDMHDENCFGVTKEIYYPDGKIDDSQRWRFTNHFIDRIIERNNEGRGYFLSDLRSEIICLFKGGVASRILSADLGFDKFFAFSKTGGVIATMDDPSQIITYLNAPSFSKKWNDANVFQNEINKFFGQGLGFYEAGINKDFFVQKLRRIADVYRATYFSLIN